MFAYLRALPRVVFKRGLPIQLIYFVTSRCNSSCLHCFLKGKLNNDTDVLRLDEIERIAKGLSGLLSLSLTGGEPFLRDDVAEIARIFYKKTGFKNLVIISNGLETEKISISVEQILSNCRSANVFIGLSFDGLAEVHNSIRGAKDAFTRTERTFRRLKGLKTRYRNLSLGTCTTCLPNNQQELLKLYEFLINLGPDGIGINLARGREWRQYIDGIDIKNYQDFTSKKLRDWKNGLLHHSNIKFNRLLYAKERMQYRFISETYCRRKCLMPCYAGRLLAVMRQNGDVFPCEMIEESTGNIRDFDYNFSRLWLGKLGQMMRREINRTRCFCTYECATTSNILFNPRYIPALIKEMFKG